MRWNTRVTAAWAVLLLVSTADAQKAAAPRLDKNFDAAIESVLKAWKVPGVGIAVVKGNEIVLLKGYGFKDLEQQQPATGNTKFAIGSVTKSFTVTAMAAQAGEGKLDWDAPVRRYLPEFTLYDPVASERMTPRDLVTHRSGLPRHDALWGVVGFGRQEMLDRLRYLEPSHDFRSVWQYQNLMYLTAGMLSAKIENRAWEDVVRARVFQPVAMNTADFSVTDMAKSPDFSYGYARLPNDSVVRIPFKNIDAIGPAGNINASAADMARYLILHMNQGKLDGKQLIPAAQIRGMHIPQMVMPTSPNPGAGGAEVGFQQYGMGFMVGTYRGRKLVQHGGNIDGFSAQMSFLPDDSVGVIVLTNMNGTQTRDFIPFMVYDRMLGLSQIDWSGRYLDQAERARARADSARGRQVASKVAGTKPSHSIADYAGTYSHPGYGDIRVSLNGDKLQFTYGIYQGVGLNHWHYDVFETEPASPAIPRRMRVQFHMDPDGKIASLTVPIEPAIKPVSYTKAK